MKNKKVLYFLLGLLGLSLILIPFGIAIFFKKDFQIKDFPENLELNYNQTFEPKYGEACYGDRFNCESIIPTIEGEVDNTILGDYKLKYIFKYNKDSLTKNQTVKVVDKESPTITINDTELKVCPNKSEVNFDVTAYDNYDQDLTSKVIQKLNGTQVEFTVTDTSGNTTKISREVTIKDSDIPAITLSGNSTIYVPLNSSYKEAGATSTDNCDGNLTSKIVINGTVDPSKAGEYNITYTVTDSSGNKNSVTRKVFVYAKNNYTAPDGKSIYLTFDDGPGPYTAKLLDVLKKYNVPATFFVTNQAITKGYDSVILRAYQEGHTIGLHTNTHNYSIYASEETYFKDLYAIQDKVKRITGETSMIIRFPGGSSNTVSKNYDGGKKIMSTLTKAVEAKGFRYFDWNVSSGDAGEVKTTQQVFNNIVKSLGNGKTYVVLQHDIKGFSVNAVEQVIQYALARGYTFRALTMDSPTVHHGLNN